MVNFAFKQLATPTVAGTVHLSANSGETENEEDYVEPQTLRCRLRPSLRDQTDPPGLREQVVVLFDEWARLSEDQPANQMHDKFVLKLQTAGFLKVLIAYPTLLLL